jgi:hypothetical protein
MARRILLTGLLFCLACCDAAKPKRKPVSFHHPIQKHLPFALVSLVFKKD